MKKVAFTLSSLFILTAILSFTVAPMKIVPKHKISFSTFGVSGSFKSFGGTIAFDPNNFGESKFDVTIAVNSIKTSFSMQDKHAKGEDWFDAAKYPTIKFTSKKIVKAGTGYQAIGDLLVHGIIKEIALPFTYKPAGNAGLFEGSFVINRNDFKVGEPGGMVGEEIKINVSVPVTK